MGGATRSVTSGLESTGLACNTRHSRRHGIGLLTLGGRVGGGWGSSTARWPGGGWGSGIRRSSSVWGGVASLSLCSRLQVLVSSSWHLATVGRVPFRHHGSSSVLGELAWCTKPLWLIFLFCLWPCQGERDATPLQTDEDHQMPEPHPPPGQQAALEPHPPPTPPPSVRRPMPCLRERRATPNRLILAQTPPIGWPRPLDAEHWTI